MGIVYKAYDKQIKRYVALKTILDIQSSAQLDLFYKECNVLKSLSHPNIVELFDIGDFEEEGVRLPYFVMPLLAGATLQELLRNSAQRMSVHRAVDIVSQTCRGLQAAHDRSIVHRDLKPSNIFVMEDDSVKIIDFGVVHMLDARSGTSRKGTLAYMSPEQIEMKPPSPASDIFSLGVVSYEILTRRRPFEGRTEEELAPAILQRTPPPASDLNPDVSPAVARVVHKAMAKQSWHRFSTAREFAETLQKAVRNEPIEIFDPARIQPRIQRARTAFQQDDYHFASEILDELEAEGNIDPAMSHLRGQIEQVVRQKKIRKLIESARTRYEGSEYPLALQKLQEALQLDPDNADALALKRVIETRRTEQKIDDWLRLTRQHIENYAFDHARQALQNVLALRPNDAQALQLVSEVERREREYLKMRQEKAGLYQTAVEAWQKGDISTALTRLERVLELDRRAPDRSSSDRANTYRSFYNEVRSEHDAVNNAYAEGRRYLADRNFKKALEICNRFLSKYSGHALFQALRFDVEEQQRQELSAFIAQTDRRVEAEPDLELRVKILEEALARCPGEAHFERALELMRGKRDFVSSIVARAQHYEEHGQFGEALGQWEILKTIHSQYPGLEFHIDGLTKRRDQQARFEAKARWVEQIDLQLKIGEYARTLDLLQEAQAEFPEDAELLELEKTARQGIGRADEAQQLLVQAQKLCAERQYDEAVDILRRAYQLDERNPALRAFLADTLVERARSVVGGDWRAAEADVQQTLELEQSHAAAKSLRTLILDQKREEFVEQCCSQAQKLQAEGNLRGALEVVEQGLSRYPADPGLIQLQATLGKLLREARRRDLDQLDHLLEQAEATADASVWKRIRERVDSIGRRHAADAEIQSAAEAVKTRLESAAKRLESVPTVSTDRQDSRWVTLWRRSLDLTRRLGGIAPPRSSEGLTTGPSVGPDRTHAVRRMGRTLTWVLAAFAFVGLTILLQRLMQRREPPTPAGPVIGLVALEIITSPLDAIVKIDDTVAASRKVELKPGTHTIEASREGYEPKVQSVQVAPGLKPVELTLRPLDARLLLVIGLDASKVFLDGQRMDPVQQSELSLPGSERVTHELRIATAQGEAVIEFEVILGSAPRVGNLTGTEDLFAVLVSQLGNTAWVYTNRAPTPASIDGSPPETLGTEGLELKNLNAGEHRLVLGEGNESRNIQFEAGTIPSLSAHIMSATDEGGLIVSANEDGAQVLVDDQQIGEIRSGRLVVTRLPVGEHRVRVVKEGLTEPEAQVVRIIKGRRRPLTFTLSPLPSVEAPRMASLRLEGGPPLANAEVLLDLTRLGNVKADGTFFHENIEPGLREIRLRQAGYKSKQITRQFEPGQTVLLSKSDLTLDSAYGRLVLDVRPPDAEIFIQEQNAPVPKGSRTVELLEGSYHLRATAPGYDTEFRVIQIQAGKPTPVVFRLASVTVTHGMEGWENPAIWRKDGAWSLYKGEKPMLYRITPPIGSFSFVWLRQPQGPRLFGGRKDRLRWVVSYIDDKNHVLFETDGKSISRKVVIKGTESPPTKILIPGGSRMEQYTLNVIVEPTRIVTQLRDGEKWIDLDAWNEPSYDFRAGKFGFHPKGDEIAIAHFYFRQSREN
jgi:serine/threonine-protein kinase